MTVAMLLKNTITAASVSSKIGQKYRKRIITKSSFRKKRQYIF